MLPLSSLAFPAVSILLASRCIVSAPLPVNSLPHEKSASHSHESPRHGSSIHDSPGHGSPTHQSPLSSPPPFEWHDHKVPTEQRLLITSTDGKYDDKLGMTANERINKYADHDVHYNGLLDVKAAHAHTADWFEKMDAAGKGQFHKSTRNFYQGGTPFIVDGKPVPASHEHLFRDESNDASSAPPLKKLKTGGDLAHHHGKHADFVSLAPIPEEELLHKMKTYKDAGVTITNGHHVSGYNSRQDVQSAKQASAETAHFVHNFEKNIRQFHPKANVFFTQSRHNFGADGNGGTQLYSDLVNRTPHKHVKTVGEDDPFAMNQIEKAEKEIKAEGKPLHPFLGANGVDRITKKEVWTARRNKDSEDPRTMKLRNNMLSAIDANTPNLKYDQTKWRLDAVKSGLLNGCQGETCDANHIILMHHAMQKGHDGFEKIRFDKKVVPFPVIAGEPHHGLTPKPHPENKAMVTKMLKEYFPIVNHEDFHEPEEKH